MGVPTSEVGYTPATPRREDHEVHKGHVVALEQKKKFCISSAKNGSRHRENCFWGGGRNVTERILEVFAAIADIPQTLAILV